MICNLITNINKNKNMFSSLTFSSSIILSCLFFKKFHFNKQFFSVFSSLSSSSLSSLSNSSELMYLQLYIPMSGKKGMPISIHNDYLLSKIIKGKLFLSYFFLPSFFLLLCESNISNFLIFLLIVYIFRN